MKYVSNGFSPKMLNPNQELIFTIDTCTYEEIQEHKEELISSIGHTTIAEHLQIEKNRMNIQLESGDTLYLVNNIENEEYDYRMIKIMEQ